MLGTFPALLAVAVVHELDEDLADDVRLALGGRPGRPGEPECPWRLRPEEEAAAPVLSRSPLAVGREPDEDPRCEHPGSHAGTVERHPRSTYRAPSVVASVRCAALTPTRTDRAGSTPCARANAIGRPGSGGRHQQLGGPPGWAHSAPSTGPETSAASAATAGASASASPPGRQSNR